MVPTKSPNVHALMKRSYMLTLYARSIAVGASLLTPQLTPRCSQGCIPRHDTRSMGAVYIHHHNCHQNPPTQLSTYGPQPTQLSPNDRCSAAVSWTAPATRSANPPGARPRTPRPASCLPLLISTAQPQAPRMVRPSTPAAPQLEASSLPSQPTGRVQGGRRRRQHALSPEASARARTARRGRARAARAPARDPQAARPRARR